MNNTRLYIFAALCVLAIITFMKWRNSPYQRVMRFLDKSAEIATVTVENNEISRRVKASRLQNFVGFELHVDVEDIANNCDLTQEEAIAAWLYVVGRKHYLTISMDNIELIESSKQRFTIDADIDIDSSFNKGKYSGIYPVTLELAYIDKKLRVVSLITRN